MGRAARVAACVAMLCALAAACDDGDVSLGSDTLEAGGAGAAAQDDGQTPPASGQDGDGAADPPAGGGDTTGNNGTGTESPSMPTDGNQAEPGSGAEDPAGGTDQACGSRGLSPCPTGQFCDFPPSAGCGETDLPGTCAPIPDACDDIYMPVCGCDGSTYENVCSAALASVSARASGECDGGGTTDPGSGDMCGGFAGFACPDGEYCDYAAGDGCDIADGLGVCKTRPDACTRDLMPVCGCNNETYSNPCEAARQNASVRHEGACDAGGGGPCGGGSVCPDGQYCQGASTDACGQNTGTCVTGATACQLIFAPVCGCDGVEYGNDCQAAAAGAGVAQTGGC